MSSNEDKYNRQLTRLGNRRITREDQIWFRKYNALQRSVNELKKDIRVLKTGKNIVASSPTVLIVPAIAHSDTTGKTVDDHHNKDHTSEHNTDGDDALNVDGIQFAIASPSETPRLIFWNSDDDTLNIVTAGGQVIQVGQELAPPAINKTGAQLDDGTVVYISGADVGTDRPKIVKADASTWEDSQMTLGLTTIDIPNDTIGPVTIAGYVRGLDTSGMTAGDRLYLSPTAGEFTTTRPVSPDYIIDLGVVVKVGVSDGVIAVNVQNNDDFGFYNKSFIEAFDLTVSESGGSIIASLERTGGGNLTMRFSTGPFTTLVTAPMTKTLTPGTAILPKINYLYILESDQTQMTLSTSAYPDEAVEHIKIARVIVLTAAITALDDPLSNQNSNDHALEHQNHVNEWIRAQRATYESPGIDGNSSTGHDYFETETVPDKVYFRSTAGTIRQMHLQAYPVKDTGSIDGGGSDVMYVVNDPDAAYTRITDLIAGITKLSDGTAWGNNKYIGLVFFGVISKSGEGQQLMCLLPLGQYNSQLGAENDINGFTNVSIPDIFRGTGFLICKIVAQKVGTTIAYKSTRNLRGERPGTIIGAGGGAAIVSFPDNTFEIFDEADPTKLINFQASGITTGNTRVITMPDKNLTLIDRSDAIMQYAPVFQVFMFNGTIQSSQNRFPHIQFPAADDNAGALWLFHIPPTWSADKMNIKIRFSIPATSGTYSVLFNAGAAVDGAGIGTFQDNLISNDSTNDFAATGTSDEVQTKTLAVDDINLDVGGFVIVAIASDASNAALLRVYEMWLEPDYT